LSTAQSPPSSSFFSSSLDHRALHSFPTRRSSDLLFVQHPLRDHGSGDLRVAQFYIQSWLLMHYLLIGNPERGAGLGAFLTALDQDRKSTRLNSSHRTISYAVFCLKKKKKEHIQEN